MGNIGVLIPIIALLIPLVAIVTKSEIGHAIADAIRNTSGDGSDGLSRQELEQLHGEVEQLRADLEQVNGQLLEVHERLDFAERLLASPDAFDKVKR